LEKICTVDPEVIGLKEINKKKEINASKTRSMQGMHAAHAKLKTTTTPLCGNVC